MSEQLTHWKKLHNPDYLGAYSIENGKDLILTIKQVKNEMVVNSDGKKEELTVIRFVEPAKPMILNTTNSKTITKIHKTPFIEKWQGKQIQLYADQIKAFGEIMEALRIRAFVPKSTTQNEVSIKCTDCSEIIKPFANMSATELAEYTKEKYKKPLCSDCAAKEAKSQTEEKEVEGENNNENN